MGLVTIILWVFLFYFMFKNMRMIKENKANKEYVNCYRKHTAGDADTLEYIEKYLEGEKDQSLITRTNIVKMAELARLDLDIEETLSKIKVEDFLYTNGVYNEANFNMCVDTTFWLLNTLSKVIKDGRNDLAERIVDLFGGVKQEVDNRLEYKLLVAIRNCLVGEGDYAFLNDLLMGEYECRYEKRFIGTYKQYAEATLKAKNIECEYILEESLKYFNTVAIGHIFMENVGIADMYKEEEKTEEVIESTEEKTEE